MALTASNSVSSASLSSELRPPRMADLGLGGELAGQQALSYQLAYLLPLALAEKLELLGLNDPQARLARIEVLLQRLQGELLA